ncbi:hypothetical protein FJT64_018797 [Amphibalanus amphitrite]|uniref:Uncharacterized protein n=1 Tax=Amphibalanus amphitrite TaxID=1232801 RepID=A0A6A4X6W4_AMPAM|nr:hypothetical protein FJT64_018797 [Amphibalanus amphitrite]
MLRPLITLTFLLTSVHHSDAVQCYQCTDHIPGTNTTCDSFSTTSSPQTCSDETCIKKVTGGRVTRYCGPRLQEEGCQYLEGGGARCVCSEDLCNGGDQSMAALVMVMVVMVMLVFGLCEEMW